MGTETSILATFVDPADGLRVDAVSESGFPIRFDTVALEDGGAAPSPTEAVLAALAACTAMDVASILRKKRQPFAAYSIAVTAQKADAHPRVFTSIVVEHRVVGDVTEEAVRRSVELSATTYCPVSAMLSESVAIEHRYRLQRTVSDLDVPSALVIVTGPASR
jgi:putative redox protein